VSVYLVCEGSGRRLDERVLDALVIQFHSLTVLMASTGAKSGHGAVCAYLENQRPPHVAISVEDRDHRPRAHAQATWGNLLGRRYIWRRHEIENYLLHPRVVLELFNDFRAAGAAWANSLPATEADVSALLRTLAGPLLEDHAAEVLRAEIVQQINAIGSLSFGPARPAPAAGSHAPGQAQWLPALQNEAARLGRTSTAVAALPALQPAALAARYTALLTTMQNPAFVAADEHLIDMGGKELLAVLSRHLHALGAPGPSVSRNELADGLLRVLAPIYQPNTTYQPDDFAELAAILRQY
jgi:hypothetical protein